MHLLLTLSLVGLFTSCLFGSVTLVSFDGTQSPTAQGWTMTGSTTVVTTTVQDAGLNVLKLVDAEGSTSTVDFLNITKSLTDTQVTSLFTQGWEYRFKFKMGSENTLAWSPDANTFATMTWYDSVAKTRKFLTLQFGRTSEGKTLVTISGATDDVKTLDAGYHDYAMIYKPETSTTELWIDGRFWKNMSAVNSTGTASYISWGDNSNQNAPRAEERTTYFTNVSLVMTPEPTVSSLLMLGATSLILRRRRV